jgi:hypothetical protein
LRRQALEWLKADLALWAKRATGDAKARAQVRATLQQWQTDADLAGIRETERLAVLPETERDTCRKLWATVAAVQKAAAGEP